MSPVSGAVPAMPDLALEAALGGRVAGIDEAGRGPWAGPVVAAAVVLDAAWLPQELATGLDDSKKLTKQVRERLYDLLMARAAIGLGSASVEEIDTLNILGATMLAMRRAVDELPVCPNHALIDGDRAPDLDIPSRCIVGGDGRALSIAAASVIAKVTRDRIMADLAAECPEYGWERNAGYGTKQHQVALDAHGVTRHHRRSFAPVARLLK